MGSSSNRTTLSTSTPYSAGSPGAVRRRSRPARSRRRHRADGRPPHPRQRHRCNELRSPRRYVDATRLEPAEHIGERPPAEPGRQLHPRRHARPRSLDDPHPVAQPGRRARSSPARSGSHSRDLTRQYLYDSGSSGGLTARCSYRPGPRPQSGPDCRFARHRPSPCRTDWGRGRHPRAWRYRAP
jgi:hypothetical protein